MIGVIKVGLILCLKFGEYFGWVGIRWGGSVSGSGGRESSLVCYYNIVGICYFRDFYLSKGIFLIIL